MRTATQRLRAVLLFGAAVVALGVAGCGGGDDSASTAAQVTDGTTQSTGQDKGGSTDDTSGGSGGDTTTGDSSDSTTIEPDVVPVDKIGIPKAPEGGDDSIQTFGEEADDQTSAEVVAGLRAYLDARAKGDWERACAFLVPGLTEQFNQLQQQQGGEELSCADILKGLSAGLPKKTLKGVAEVNVGGVRVKGEQAFVVFKGDHNLWYFAPMGLVDGTWKSGSLAPSVLP